MILRRQKSYLLVWVLSAVFCCNALIAQESAPVLLEQSNLHFQQLYRNAKDNALKSVGPIIIAKGDFLILQYNQQRTEVQYLPKMYHQLKAVDHIPLMLYVLLSTYDDTCLLTLSQKAQLEHILSEVETIRGSLQKEPKDSLLDEKQEICLAATSIFLNQLLSQGQIDREQNGFFFRDIAPLLLANAAEAAFLQLDALHQQVQQWKKQIPVDEWNRLAVIIMGPSMPRIGEVTMQYFARLTGKPMEVLGAKNYPWITSAKYPKDDVQQFKQNRRLVYAENISTEVDALNLLATHVIDEDIGAAFFDDNMRMHCDLLAEAASKRLEEKCDGEHKHKITE